MGLTLQQATIHEAKWQVEWILPGVQDRVESDIENVR